MESNQVLMMVVMVMLLAMYLWFRQKPNYNLAPKIIWTYWDNPAKIPKTVTMCMKEWAKWNPDYEIILLTQKNYTGYVTIPYEIRTHPNFYDNPARLADLVRVWVLAERGGVWIDSSVILKGRLDDWLFPKYSDFSGFYIESNTTNPKYPLIENWFFACNKNCLFLQKWRDEFSEIARFPSVEKYVESRIKMGTDIQGMKDPIDLAMHVSAQKVLQLDHFSTESMILQNAEEGPFRYLVDAKWDSEKAVELACMDHTYQFPIMKMRGNERKVVEKKIGEEGWVEKCGFIS